MPVKLVKETIEKFNQALLTWYDVQKRDLPWRRSRDPYAIWLSEVMLQQTQVQTVIPYYKRFLKTFPTLKSVATASESDLLKHWEGLGYYSRIRQFQKACQVIVETHAGMVPEDLEALLNLPGLGPYTARAVISIAHQKKHGVVDGNVIRVLSRLTAWREDKATLNSKFFFQTTIDTIIPEKRPGDFNQAMMELGATICSPKSPKCLICPVANFCKVAQQSLNAEEFPKQIKKIKYIEQNWIAGLWRKSNQIWMRQRKPGELMAGLWEPPIHITTEEITQKILETFLGKGKHTAHPTLSHSITNKRITIHPVEAKNKNPNTEGIWVPLSELNQYPLTTLTKKIFRAFDAKK